MATTLGYLINTTGSAPAVSESTSFGIYDNDVTFQLEAPQTAKWVAFRLGGVLMQVELTFPEVYNAFEEAVSEYSTLVNNSQIKDWLLNFKGFTTGSDLTNTNPLASYEYQKRYSDNIIGSEVGVGGVYDWKTGSIDLVADQQYYDVQALWGSASESNQRLELKEIWHYRQPAIQRGRAYGSGQAMINSEFAGMGSVAGTAGTQYLVYPLYSDILRAQAVELSDMIRKSGYSHEVINNVLRLTPTPTEAIKLFFRYRINFDPFTDDDRSSQTDSVISSPADIPYSFLPYTSINSPGKQWIRKYTLAICKEMLARNRSKFTSINIPENEVTLDGDALLSEGQAEKEALIEQFKEFLEGVSNEKLMESEALLQEHMENQFKHIPMLPRIG
jgi:hypothetical protein